MDQAAGNMNRVVVFLRMQFFDINFAALKLLVGFPLLCVGQAINDQKLIVASLSPMRASVPGCSDQTPQLFRASTPMHGAAPANASETIRQRREQHSQLSADKTRHALEISASARVNGMSVVKERSPSRSHGNYVIPRNWVE